LIFSLHNNGGFYNPPTLDALNGNMDPLLNAFRMKNNMRGGFGNMNGGLGFMGNINLGMMGGFSQPMLPNVGLHLNSNNLMNNLPQGFKPSLNNSPMANSASLNTPTDTLPPQNPSYNFRQKDILPPSANISPRLNAQPNVPVSSGMPGNVI
jgi:hypothetical protein